MAHDLDALAELLRDAQGHALWLRDAREVTVLKAAVAPVLLRPSAPIPPAPTRAPSVDPAAALLQVRSTLGECTRCKLCSTRKSIVFGVGSPRAELVFVGEGPGENEDLQGEPFVGEAGGLLDKMIVAMGLSRAEVYICNVVKCRPPGNRNPEPDEIAACAPFLHGQLDAIAPRAIVALGKFAAQTLLQDPTPITKLRGTWRTYRGVPLMPTFHPSYLLRDASQKKHVWADLQQVMKALGLPRAT
jgi:uracil-DNA glycosylase family 4